MNLPTKNPIIPHEQGIRRYYRLQTPCWQGMAGVTFALFQFFFVSCRKNSKFFIYKHMNMKNTPERP